jgi:hypothetical protein
MEETLPPLVGASTPTNTNAFPTTPYAFMDMIFGILYGSFGYLLSKNRKGDCMSSMLSFAPSFGGYAGNFDKAWSPSVSKMLYDVPMWIFHVWGMMKIVATCTGQYAFSVQNPWRDVFMSKGEMNPYVIGEEARRRMAANGTLAKGGNFMQAQVEAEKDIKEGEVDATDVWKGASEEVGDIDGEDSDADDFTGPNDFNEFLSENGKYKDMVSEMEELPFGAENWIYSKWNYKKGKAAKLSPYWWFTFILKFVKVVHTFYSCFGKIDSHFYFYDAGRKCGQGFFKVIFLINGATDWKLFDGMKPWARRAPLAPKPDNYKELKFRPTSWSADK